MYRSSANGEVVIVKYAPCWTQFRLPDRRMIVVFLYKVGAFAVTEQTEEDREYFREMFEILPDLRERAMWNENGFGCIEVWR